VDRLTKVAHFIPVKMTYTRVKLAELYNSRIVYLHGVPKDSVRSRHSVYFTVLAEVTLVNRYKAKFQFSIPSSDRWADRENKSDP
jgi:hypothetical protein